MEQSTETMIQSVTDYANQIGRAVRSVSTAIVEGEVQKPRVSPAGLLYFDLTDGDAKLSCKVFRNGRERLEHTPDDGDLVQVRVDRPDFWTSAGKLDLIVSNVRLAGEGELLNKRAQLLLQLKQEGLCDESTWKTLPEFPRAVGVIAGKDSDGREDVIRGIADRYPPAYIVCCDAQVQGASAPNDLVDAIAVLQQHPQVDVIVLARGGGSVQDLVAFDDERVCRAVNGCAVPVVAAIGHTKNVPVCNHVTYAATTPSRSAELVVPSAAELLQNIALGSNSLELLKTSTERKLEQLAVPGSQIDPKDLVTKKEHSVGDARHTISNSEQRFFATCEANLGKLREVVSAAPHRARATVSLLAQNVSEQRQQISGSRTIGDREAALASLRAVVDIVPHRMRAAISSLDQELAEQRNKTDASSAIGTCLDAVSALKGAMQVGIHRQLEDHERDYGNALTRLLIEIRRNGERRIVEANEQVLRASQATRERVLARVDRAERDRSHVVALINARDFREQGFVLATDANNQPISSVAGLRIGSHLKLNFRDGRARAVVDEIEEE